MEIRTTARKATTAARQTWRAAWLQTASRGAATPDPTTCAVPTGRSAVRRAPRATPARTGRPATSRGEAAGRSGGGRASIMSHHGGQRKNSAGRNQVEDENLKILNRNDTHMFVCPITCRIKGSQGVRMVNVLLFLLAFLIRRINKSLRWFGVVCVPVSAIVEVTIHMP